MNEAATLNGVEKDDEVIDDTTGEVTNPGHIFDGLLYTGRLVRVRDIKSSKTGNVVEGMCNLDFISSRGNQTLTGQKQLKTPVGNFDKTREYNTLTHPDSIGKFFAIAIGEINSGGFTNFVPIFVKEV